MTTWAWLQHSTLLSFSQSSRRHCVWGKLDTKKALFKHSPFLLFLVFSKLLLLLLKTKGYVAAEEGVWGGINQQEACGGGIEEKEKKKEKENKQDWKR